MLNLVLFSYPKRKCPKYLYHMGKYVTHGSIGLTVRKPISKRLTLKLMDMAAVDVAIIS